MPWVSGARVRDIAPHGRPTMRYLLVRDFPVVPLLVLRCDISQRRRCGAGEYGGGVLGPGPVTSLAWAGGVLGQGSVVSLRGGRPGFSVRGQGPASSENDA